MVYIRKKPKGFGQNQQIEGHFKEKEKALKYEKWYKSRGYNANYRKTLDKKLIKRGSVSYTHLTLPTILLV